jgi:hypothetical protein
MCGLPSSWSGQRLQAGCYEHISETSGFHRSQNSWTVEWLLAFQEEVCFVELVMYVNAFGGQGGVHICGVWRQLCSKTCLKAWTNFMYPSSFKIVFKSLLVCHKRTLRCAPWFLTLREGQRYWTGTCDLAWMNRRKANWRTYFTTCTVQFLLRGSSNRKEYFG